MQKQLIQIYRELKELQKRVLKGQIKDAYRQYEAIKHVHTLYHELFMAFYARKLVPLKKAFVEVNNAYVLDFVAQNPPKKTLILLPFCLQSTECGQRIIWDIDNCIECKKCPVGNIKGLAHKHNVTIRVAERGLIAKDIISTERPDLTIAIACDDELYEGIIRAKNDKVLGLENRINKDYCINTSFDVENLVHLLDQQLRSFNA